jgi:hypothetical protein
MGKLLVIIMSVMLIGFNLFAAGQDVEPPELISCNDFYSDKSVAKIQAARASKCITGNIQDDDGKRQCLEKCLAAVDHFLDMYPPGYECIDETMDAVIVFKKSERDIYLSTIAIWNPWLQTH